MVIKLISVYNHLQSDASRTVTLLCFVYFSLPTTSGTNPGGIWGYNSFPKSIVGATTHPNTFTASIPQQFCITAINWQHSLSIYLIKKYSNLIFFKK